MLSGPRFRHNIPDHICTVQEPIDVTYFGIERKPIEGDAVADDPSPHSWIDIERKTYFDGLISLSLSMIRMQEELIFWAIQ